MLRHTLAPLLALIATLVLAGPAQAGGPTMVLGAAEDALRSPDLVTAKAKMTALRLAGFRAVRVTSKWTPGEVAPTDDELDVLRNVTAAARLTGIRVYVSVFNPGSKTTPRTPEERSEFARYAGALVGAVPALDDVIVGNEPNLNGFWMPQFNTDSTSASPAAYLALLAQAYDSIKSVDPDARVWGGALAPRGADRPDGKRQTHSPTRFLQELGAAYRASGRELPIMDGLAHHPYPDHSSQPPDLPHPKNNIIALADYEKLVRILGEAFDGTAQPGSTLPILYDEFGIESLIPPGKAAAYTGVEPRTTHPVAEDVQGRAYQRGLELAFCQPNVVAMLFFHSEDETNLNRWQSGVYYADGTPKSSLPFVRDALNRTRGGSIAHCDGLELDVRATLLKFPTAKTFRKGNRVVRLRCSLDCRWDLVAVRASTGRVVARRRGFARIGVVVKPSLRGAKLGTTPVRLRVTLVHPVNPGVPFERVSTTLRTH
jgi:hypothetical protein